MAYRKVALRPRRRLLNSPRLIMAVVIAGFALLSYQCSSEYNPVTGEDQHIAMTEEQEIALGLQAVPEMMAQHGGLSPDQSAQQLVDRVGERLVAASDASETPWQFEFHLLADPELVNAFALPGGQIFITEALLRRFKTEGELAGVLGHEIGHVVARHSAERLAQQQLTQGLTGAVLVATGAGGSEAQVAQMVSQLINMKYGRDDELQSDVLGVRFMARAGYDPRALMRVMQILESAGGGRGQPEWMSTHPSHGNRIETIAAAIEEMYPDGVPPSLID